MLWFVDSQFEKEVASVLSFLTDAMSCKIGRARHLVSRDFVGIAGMSWMLNSENRER